MLYKNDIIIYCQNCFLYMAIKQNQASTLLQQLITLKKRYAGLKTELSILLKYNFIQK